MPHLGAVSQPGWRLAAPRVHPVCRVAKSHHRFLFPHCVWDSFLEGPSGIRERECPHSWETKMAYGVTGSFYPEVFTLQRNNPPGTLKPAGHAGGGALWKVMRRGDSPFRSVGRAGISLQIFLPLQLPLWRECRQGIYNIPLFLKDGTTALLKAAIKGYNNVIEELLKFSPTLGLLKVSSETQRLF